MGSACCVAARDGTLINRAQGETAHMNAIYSPSWSFQWENQGHVVHEEDTSYQFPHGMGRNVGMGMKGNFSAGGSSLENPGTPASMKSPLYEGISANSLKSLSDLSLASNYSVEVKTLRESPEADSVAPKLSFSLPSPFSAPSSTGTPSSQPHPIHSNLTSSRRARRSPGHQLLRQVSDGRIPGPKSPSRTSFVLSSCSNGSHGESSDGWSMRTFSELVASSRRERWSFDSGHLGSGNDKISGPSSRFSCSPTTDARTCGACSKLLAERPSVGGNEISVVAVLVCGHAYHAQCLESWTLEGDKYDPACLTCAVGEGRASDASRKASSVEAETRSKCGKIPRNRVVDSYLDGGFDVFDEERSSSKREGKALEAASSSGGRPFLKRRFSFGSRWSTRKKGFWAKYL